MKPNHARYTTRPGKWTAHGFIPAPAEYNPRHQTGCLTAITDGIKLIAFVLLTILFFILLWAVM